MPMLPTTYHSVATLTAKYEASNGGVRVTAMLMSGGIGRGFRFWR